MIRSDKRLIVVLGMHRSGTSAITRALNVFGVDIGENLMPPVGGNNEKGFFEDIDLNKMNIEILQEIGSDWHSLAPIGASDIETLCKKGLFLRAIELIRRKTKHADIFGFKDPRVAKLVPFWQQVFLHCGFDVSYVLAIRNPLSVARSLANRDGFSHEKSFLLWLGHVVTSVVHTEGYKRVLVDYDKFLYAPISTLEVVAERLALKVDTQSLKEYVSEFLDVTLRHTVYQKGDLAFDRACPPMVVDLYTELTDVAEDNAGLDKPEFAARTALWREEFQRLEVSLRCIDHLTAQVTWLSSLINARDTETTQIITCALLQDQDIFIKSFDRDWYLKKYPDVAAAGVDPYGHYISSGVAEGRLPSADVPRFVRDGLLSRLNETTALLTLEKELSASQKVESVNREHTFCQQLQKIEQQESALINERAEREQAHRTQLKETREQIETSILEHKEQVEFLSQRCCELEQARQQQLVEQSHELAAQEQGYIQRLSLAQQNFETQAQEIAKREKEYFLQIQEMQGTHAQQMQDLHRANCEREVCEGGKLAQALQKLHDQSLAHAEREKTFFQVVLETERACLNQVERERESTEREKFLLEELTNARREVQSHLIEIARRESCFSSRLQEMVASYELKNDEHSREQLEHLKALDLQAVAQKELLNSVDQRCAEIENRILPSLSDLQEMAASYKLKNDEHSREQLEYLRALDLQAIAQKELLNSVDHRFAEIESKILPSLSEVNKELNATRDTRSWRYTAPFRLLAAMVGIKQTTRPAARLPDTPDDRA